MCYNPKLDLVNINAYIKFGEILSICSGYEIMRPYLWSRAIPLKTMCNNPNLDLININAYTNSREILSICFGNEIMKDRQTDGQLKSSIAPLFQSVKHEIQNCKFILTCPRTSK